MRISSEKHPNFEINRVDISGIAKGKYLVEYFNPDRPSVYLSDLEIN